MSGPDRRDGDRADADRAEPEDSPQRRLVDSVRAYEVDPPAPERTRREQPADEAGR